MIKMFSNVDQKNLEKEVNSWIEMNAVTVQQVNQSVIIGLNGQIILLTVLYKEYKEE